MTEETTTTGTALLEATAFARELCRIMEARGIPTDQEHAAQLAERSGLDPEAFRARLAGEPGANPGDLSRLAKELALARHERRVLALAYTLEEDFEEPITPEERDLYDAKADEEAWSHAIEILEPMTEIARVFGSEELIRVLTHAREEADRELNRALDVLEALQEPLQERETSGA